MHEDVERGEVRRTARSEKVASHAYFQYFITSDAHDNKKVVVVRCTTKL